MIGVQRSLHQLLGTGSCTRPAPGKSRRRARRRALVYLDFGMVVEVPETARRAMIRGLVGFVNRDAESPDDLADLRFLPETTNGPPPPRRSPPSSTASRATPRAIPKPRTEVRCPPDPPFAARMIFGRRVATDDGAGGARVQASALFREGASRARPRWKAPRRGLTRISGSSSARIRTCWRASWRTEARRCATYFADSCSRRTRASGDGTVCAARGERVRRVRRGRTRERRRNEKTETKEKKTRETCAMTRAVMDAVRCAVETAAGAAITRARWLSGRNLNARRARMTTRIPRRRRRLFETPRGTSCPPRARRFARGWFGISSTRATRGSPRSRTRRPSRRGGGV